tara:strand:+ start:4062 stop:4310 length:249 start_codon:yes stop_codon:yes gene_type:complete
MMDGRHDLPEKGVIQLQDYRESLFQQIGDVIVRAWNKRAPAQVAWGHAVIAQNRKAVYANTTAEMYGKSNRSDFRGIVGDED